MATAHKIHIDAADTGLWKIKQTEEAARKTSELLQKDLETHHVFFNDSGFHNHVVHHILSLFGTGATASQIQRGYDNNDTYQKPSQPTHEHVVQELSDWSQASQYLGKGKHYPDFLAFFQREIDAKGWQAVLAEHLLPSDPTQADDLFSRLFAGLLHPIIQLMYGLEWAQPALVAEGLAQACVHAADIKEPLLRAERDARDRYAASADERMPSIVALMDEAREDPVLGKAAREDDHARIGAGMLERTPEEMARILSRVQVRPEELDERTAEMFHASLYAAASATFHGNKVNKFDFILMHHVNLAPIFLTLNAQPWLSVETKVRLLEWKIRYDLLHYAGQGVPDLLVDQLKAYEPHKPDESSIDALHKDLMRRVHNLPSDDGHAIKLSRAAVICEGLAKKYKDADWLVLKGDDLWRRIHNLIADSFEAPGTTFALVTGYHSGWDAIPDRPKL